MKNSVKLGALSATVLLAACATGGTGTVGAPTPQARADQSGYVVGGQGDNIVLTSPFSDVNNPAGLCWRGAFWDPSNAQQGCDEDLIPKPPPPPAAVIVPPAPVPAPAPVPVAPPKVVSEKVTYAADAFYDFDKATLKPEGKAKLDELAAKIKDFTLEVVIAVGHTDSVGSDAYNQKLSLRRAESVKAYLVSKGIEANRVYTEGKGKKQPLADNKTADGRAKNRRVEIEVVGTRTVK
ncbi:MAG: OmpA family protein [Burkholderiales bacterium]